MRPFLKTMIAALLSAASVQPVIGSTQTATRAPVQQHPAPAPASAADRAPSGRAAERRRRQGRAGGGGPWHARHGAEVGDPRCGCSQCVRARREGLQL